MCGLSRDKGWSKSLVEAIEHLPCLPGKLSVSCSALLGIRLSIPYLYYRSYMRFDNLNHCLRMYLAYRVSL